MSTDEAGEATTEGAVEGPAVPALPRRKAKAEAAHRASIEPYRERLRRIEFPWGLAALNVTLVLGIGGPGVWSGYEIGKQLGWWG